MLKRESKAECILCLNDEKIKLKLKFKKFGIFIAQIIRLSESFWSPPRIYAGEDPSQPDSGCFLKNTTTPFTKFIAFLNLFAAAYE